MRAFRAEAVLALLASVVVASTGCSPSTSEQPPSPASSSPPPAAAARRVDLARLGSIADAFPPGHPANPLFGPGKVDELTGSAVGDLVSYGKALTVDPDSCRALLKPVEAKAGADSASITSATGPQDPFIAVSADDPVSVQRPFLRRAAIGSRSPCRAGSPTGRSKDCLHPALTMR